MTNPSRAIELLLPLLLVSGCVADDDDATDTTDTTEQSIVGTYAFPTTARPEIGQVFLGNGSCTGTLIGVRTVLTASHCLYPPYVATTAVAGSVFQFTDAGGALRSYAVDDVVSFNPEGDVALVRLVSGVPTAQAIPAAVSVAPPVTNDMSTVFGYGCNSRLDGGSGYGTKRAYGFRYGVLTDVLCWGDSGGPVTFGYSTQRGAIWGVNVGSSGTHDLIAVPSYLEPQIESVMHGWDNTYMEQEIGMDRPGMDYAAYSTPNSPGCAVACRNDGDCRAFSWVAATATCYLKDGVPDPYPTPGVTSGLAPSSEVGIDRPGNDIAIYYGMTAESCRETCVRNQVPCSSWTLVDGGACYLKNAVPAAYASSSCTSGVIDRMFEPGYDRPGGNLRQTHASLRRDCAQDCARDASCKAYVWSATRTVPGTSNNCWLKHAVTPAVASTAFFAGVKRGMDVGLRRHGNTLRSIHLTAPLWPQTATNALSSLSAYSCQAACAQDGDCQGWDLTLEPDSGGTCVLLDNYAPVILAGAARHISGMRKLEYLP